MSKKIQNPKQEHDKEKIDGNRKLFIILNILGIIVSTFLMLYQFKINTTAKDINICIEIFKYFDILIATGQTGIKLKGRQKDKSVFSQIRGLLIVQIVITVFLLVTPLSVLFNKATIDNGVISFLKLNIIKNYNVGTYYFISAIVQSFNILGKVSSLIISETQKTDEKKALKIAEQEKKERLELDKQHYKKEEELLSALNINIETLIIELSKKSFGSEMIGTLPPMISQDDSIDNCQSMCNDEFIDKETVDDCPDKDEDTT